MAESTGVLPGLSPVAGKPVHAAFDGGRLTSDAGVLLLAEIDRRLGICERLVRCIEDPRAPERVQHTLAEMICFCALLIAAGYPDANDCDALRSDPAFKMAVGRLPESGGDLCSQPTISRLENPKNRKERAPPMVRWSMQEIRRVADRLTQRAIEPATVIAWSTWRRCHQALANETHKRKAQL
ncbi:transposase [Azospirillum formosense]|nr:transposase [Azospirillum formosense]